MIRVMLPTHLRRLAEVNREIAIEADGPMTLELLLDRLERQYPMLRGTLRDHLTQQRRPFIRYFACGQDLTHAPPDTLLPDAVLTGLEPLRVVGAMAGG